MIEVAGDHQMTLLERAMPAELLGLEISPVTIVQKAEVIDFAQACAELRRRKAAHCPLQPDQEIKC